jgi:acetyl esterase/lipase
LQIEDGLQRGDIPYLVAAGANIRSWVDYRHTWKDSAAQKIANELTEKIDVATWTVDAYAAQYAADLADDYVDAWQFLISPIAAGNYTLDPSDIQTGALAPLFNPKPKKPAKKSPITFKNGEILVDVMDNIADNISDDQTGE